MRNISHAFFIYFTCSSLMIGCATHDPYTGQAIPNSALSNALNVLTEIGSVMIEANKDSESPSSNSSGSASPAIGGACSAKLDECKKHLQPDQYCTVKKRPDGVCCVGHHESNGFVLSTTCNNGFGSAN